MLFRSGKVNILAVMVGTTGQVSTQYYLDIPVEADGPPLNCLPSAPKAAKRCILYCQNFSFRRPSFLCIEFHYNIFYLLLQPLFPAHCQYQHQNAEQAQRFFRVKLIIPPQKKRSGHTERFSFLFAAKQIKTIPSAARHKFDKIPDLFSLNK